MDGRHGLSRNDKDAQPARQLESLRSCRSWIEEQCLAEPFNFRLVRVTEDADIRLFTIQKGSPVSCELPAFIHHMPESNTDSKECHHSFRWKPTLFVPVDVAGDGGDRRDLLQLFDYGPITNVPGVENVIDASEMSPDGRIEQAMGIGNYSDSNGSALVHGAATG
jgi:hypothetical protein